MCIRDRLSIDPDAHVIGGFDDVYFGVMAAQKGGLTAKHNLSSFTLKEFEAFLAKKPKPVSYTHLDVYKRQR